MAERIFCVIHECLLKFPCHVAVFHFVINIINTFICINISWYNIFPIMFPNFFLKFSFVKNMPIYTIFDYIHIHWILSSIYIWLNQLKWSKIQVVRFLPAEWDTMSFVNMLSINEEDLDIVHRGFSKVDGNYGCRFHHQSSALTVLNKVNMEIVFYYTDFLCFCYDVQTFLRTV